MYVVKKSYQTQDTLKGTKAVGEQYMLNVCLNSEKIRRITMENPMEIIKFVSEEEKKRFEKEVVNLILHRVDVDLVSYDYHLVDYDEIEVKMNEAIDEMVKRIAEELEKRYKKQLEDNFASMIRKVVV